MSLIRFCCVASTISSSLPSNRPSASMATRNAFVPSVTFSIKPGGRPTSAAVVIDRAIEASLGLQIQARKHEIADTAVVETERPARG